MKKEDNNMLSKDQVDKVHEKGAVTPSREALQKAVSRVIAKHDKALERLAKR